MEKYRNICEILITGKDHDVKTVQESDESMQDAVNSASTTSSARPRRTARRSATITARTAQRQAATVTEWAVQVLEPGAAPRGRRGAQRRASSRPTTSPIRPMSIEEAALRLDDSKNEFIVFRDIDTDKVSVIYKRRDNNLGLIAPEF